MNVIDRGSGPPLVLIPGLQGRWEYMRATVDALSAGFRVITFSLDDKARGKADVASGLSRYAAQVAGVLSDARIERATICGISFGGLVAVRFAAQHPERCSALVLASTPGPTMRLKKRHQIYMRAPWVFGPLFLVETPWRLRPEIRAAIPDAKARRRLSWRTLRTVINAPVSLSGMAARARMIGGATTAADCARITAPTLIVTGERQLDHVVPVDGSNEYVRLIAAARAVVLERSGHLGSITRPDAFAAVLRDFFEGQRHAAA
jgi:3-oxoadipate enol-lactonase